MSSYKCRSIIKRLLLLFWIRRRQLGRRIWTQLYRRGTIRLLNLTLRRPCRLPSSIQVRIIRLSNSYWQRCNHAWPRWWIKRQWQFPNSDRHLSREQIVRKVRIGSRTTRRRLPRGYPIWSTCPENWLRSEIDRGRKWCSNQSWLRFQTTSISRRRRCHFRPLVLIPTPSRSVRNLRPSTLNQTRLIIRMARQWRRSAMLTTTWRRKWRVKVLQSEEQRIHRMPSSITPISLSRKTFHPLATNICGKSIHPRFMKIISKESEVFCRSQRLGGPVSTFILKPRRSNLLCQ